MISTRLALDSYDSLNEWHVVKCRSECTREWQGPLRSPRLQKQTCSHGRSMQSRSPPATKVGAGYVEQCISPLMHACGTTPWRPKPSTGIPGYYALCETYGVTDIQCATSRPAGHLWVIWVQVQDEMLVRSVCKHTGRCLVNDFLDAPKLRDGPTPEKFDVFLMHFSVKFIPFNAVQII